MQVHLSLLTNLPLITALLAASTINNYTVHNIEVDNSAVGNFAGHNCAFDNFALWNTHVAPVLILVFMVLVARFNQATVIISSIGAPLCQSLKKIDQ